MSPHRKRVVVIESDDIVLALILHILKRQGFDVDTAVDAAAALEFLAKRPDVVIADGGVVSQLADVLRTMTDRLIITGHSESLREEACAVVRKPLEVALLVDTVKRCAR